jgi:hypothetical protein
MNAMHNILAATAMYAATFATGAADTDPHAQLPAELRQAAADFDRAQLHSDTAELQRLLADDYVLYNSAGKVEGKADFIRDYAGMKLQPFTVEDETLRVFGDAARVAWVNATCQRPSRLRQTSAKRNRTENASPLATSVPLSVATPASTAASPNTRIVSSSTLNGCSFIPA